MNEKLQEAASLYKKGDKSQACKLLMEIVRQDPLNTVAWYGLASCVDELDKKVYCLERILTIDPSNKKAQQMLDKLQGIKKSPNQGRVTEIQSPSLDENVPSNSQPVITNTSRISWGNLKIAGIIILAFGGFFGISYLLGLWMTSDSKYSDSNPLCMGMGCLGLIIIAAYFLFFRSSNIARNSYSTNVPKCPTCGSTNIQRISTASKVGKVALFGIFAVGAVGKTFKCNNCGYQW
jgi:predicted RNA-binding Zn-ribbon protein involved in translation (DUF1610 family)